MAPFLLIAAARVPWGWYLRRLLTAAVLYLLFLVWLPFVIEPGDATVHLGVLTLSVTGSLRWLILSAKLGGMISLMLVLLATTSLHDTFKAARVLGLPRLLVLLLLLTFRYVILLMDEFARLRIALRVRGFRNAANLHSYRTIGQVAGTLLVRSHERAERVGHAMRCRGFDGEFRSLHDFRAGWTDAPVFAAIVGSAAGLLACGIGSYLNSPLRPGEGRILTAARLDLNEFMQIGAVWRRKSPLMSLACRSPIPMANKRSTICACRWRRGRASGWSGRTGPAKRRCSFASPAY